MIPESELEALAAFDGEQPVLSVYLDTDLAQQSKEAVRLRFRHCLRSLPEEPRPADVEAVESLLQFEFDWQALGLAVFSCGGDYWRVYPLPVAPTTQVFIGPRPYLRPLTAMSDRFGRYVVALFDREGARLLAVNGGRSEELAEALGEGLKRHRQGGWSAARLQRHADQVAQRNIKAAIEETASFCDAHDCTQLVLAGSLDLLATVEELMPRPLRDQVIGKFVCDVRSSPQDVLSESYKVTDAVHRATEKRLVDQAVTAAAKGENGAAGLADVLFNLQQGRVHQLLVLQGFRAPGRRCDACGYIVADQVANCPICSEDEMLDLPDAVDESIQKAIGTGAEVHVVPDNETLAEAGGVAALLRY